MKYADEDAPRPACEGEYLLFWSRDLVDHNDARLICNGYGNHPPCPFLNTCAPPRHGNADGTYGGILYINGRPQTKLAALDSLDVEQNHILNDIADLIGVDPTQILDRSHNANRPRHLAAYLLMVGRGMSSTAVGKILCRDHSSILNSVKRVGEDPELLAVATSLIQVAA